MKRIISQIPKYKYFAVSNYVGMHRKIPRVFMEVKVENEVKGKIVIEVRIL
jgi:hypothetical protein